MTDAIYVVRAGRSGALVDDLLSLDIVALGWDEVGPIDVLVS